MVLWWSLPLAWAATLFFLSTLPGDDLHLPSFFELDKLLHFGAFGWLAALVREAARRTTRLAPETMSWLAIVATTVYGATDEIHQLVGVAGRTADPYDWLADTIGAVVFALLHARIIAALRVRN